MGIKYNLMNIYIIALAVSSCIIVKVAEKEARIS